MYYLCTIRSFTYWKCYQERLRDRPCETLATLCASEEGATFYQKFSFLDR